MTDTVDIQTRSRMMASIGSKNTKPELALRQKIHRLGYRYRLHVRQILGCPDLVFPKFSAVVFVHGCFWHHHDNCRYATTPATRTEFWKGKFMANSNRDKQVCHELLDSDWRVATIWECALRKPIHSAETVERLVDWLNSDRTILDIGSSDLNNSGQSNQ
ncbi:T/G mismatch-specific endonuclease [Cohaesibacter sp. ES.047]|uniref:very short patch repair endonuclease n=1 Tax=Cohaesibacter sp. ES.047 TaxID=1798205 RepID=UPI000BB7E8F0|nr:very short patch repair endonuclease [Cohaesibacter sp. ES.047]SNY92307.1 T/G mismatch-specific endonuclease [Cohaesibacter sp. ES.047]